MISAVTALLPGMTGVNDPETFPALAGLLGQMGIRVVIYTDETLWPTGTRLNAYSDLTFQQTSAASFLDGLWMWPKLQARCMASGVPTPAAQRLAMKLRKVGLLHDESIWAPANIDFLIWLDADLLTCINPLYLTQAGLLKQLPAILDRFLVLTYPESQDCPDGGPIRVSGQLFGGPRETIRTLNTAYWNQYATEIEQERIPTEESLMTHLLHDRPDFFNRFKLQDNGLAGSFFEELRCGSINIEQTLVVD